MDESARERVKELLTSAAALPTDRRASYVNEHAGDPLVAREALALLPTLEDSAFMSAATIGQAVASHEAAVSHPGETEGQQIGRYKLLQRIGEGGFGTVYMAEQTEPVVRRVALKIIKAGMDTRQVIARFEAERQALAMMDHPNIARVLDAGATDHGRPYFVMDLVRGEPITHYCDRAELPVAERLNLFREVCAAVQHAHQKGIIHRDLKPSNVLITIADGEPLSKVIDFGIAKATMTRLTDKTVFTELHQLMGTPEYMSPEQAEAYGVDIDTRSDIYALGVLLYEMLTGTTPFDGRRLLASGYNELLRILHEEEPPRPSLRIHALATPSSGLRHQGLKEPQPNPTDSSALDIARRRRTEPTSLARSLRGDLDWIVMKCLEKDRRRRYETASALAEDVLRFLGNQPVRARPPSAGYEVRKFVRRHRGAVLAGAAIAAVMVLGIVGTTTGLVWALRAQRFAEEQKLIALSNAAAAKSQAERADREAEEALATSEFMRSVLTSAAPENQGADVRLVDVLSGASASAPERFAGQPLQEARVHEILGKIYGELSMFLEAKEEYREALRLRQQHIGVDDPVTLTTEARYAGIAIDLEQVSEAERVLADLVPRMERVLGPDDTDTLDARRGLAIVHAQRGRLDEAERILLELRGHPRLTDDNAMQLKLARTLLAINRRRSSSVEGAESVMLLQAGEGLAQEWFERALQEYGPDSITTLRSRVKLAEIHCRLGDFEEAAKNCREILDASLMRLGECHVIRTEAMSALAEALTRMGETREPAELQLRIVACERGRLAADSPVWLSELSEALRFLDRGGFSVEGEALARELTAALLNLGGGHDSMATDSEVYVARFVSMQERFEEAEELFRELFDREGLISHDRKRARLHLFYGSHLARRGKFEEAEKHLQRAAELVGDVRLGTWDTHPDDVILEFIALYERWDRREQAAAYRDLREEVMAMRGN